MSIKSQPRAMPQTRADFHHFMPVDTRWNDNDTYGHINNAVYYFYFDSVVNSYLIAQKVLDPKISETIGLVAETGCSYFSPLSFPEKIEAGLRVRHMGTSSVVYGIGLFSAQANETAALGKFVHVYVDAKTRRPVNLPENLRQAVERLQVT